MNFLAIDSATDALSLALGEPERLRAIHRVMPRQHQQQLFMLLDELTQGTPLRELGLDALVYGRGPGSFTGLRIAVSAVQGLAYSLRLPVIGVSSLETQARTLLRQQDIRSPCLILSTLNARIEQVYAAWYHFDGEALTPLDAPVIASPDALVTPAAALRHSALEILGVGTGFELQASMPVALQSLARCWPALLPEAQDMLAPAGKLLQRGEYQQACEAAPDYVQQRIGWKTLAEQERKA